MRQTLTSALGMLFCLTMLLCGANAPQEQPFHVVIQPGRKGVLQAESVAFWVEVKCSASGSLSADGRLVIDDQYPKL